MLIIVSICKGYLSGSSFNTIWLVLPRKEKQMFAKLDKIYDHNLWTAQNTLREGEREREREMENGPKTPWKQQYLQK